jgi:hypothetical protein
LRRKKQSASGISPKDKTGHKTPGNKLPEVSFKFPQTHASPVINYKLLSMLIDMLKKIIKAEAAKKEKYNVSEIVRKDSSHVGICFDLQ